VRSLAVIISALCFSSQLFAYCGQAIGSGKIVKEGEKIYILFNRTTSETKVEVTNPKIIESKVGLIMDIQVFINEMCFHKCQGEVVKIIGVTSPFENETPLELKPEKLLSDARCPKEQVK
jgi:hypothetical protein